MVPITTNGSQKNKGYILVAVIVMTVILSISMAVLTEKWSYLIKREKENELLFRGNEYAQAIKRFYLMHKRYPFSLEELIKSQPRCIRRLYKEPFSKNGEWGLIYLSDIASGRVFKKNNAQPNTPHPVPIGRIYSRKPTTIGIGQIAGVYSHCKDRPFKDFMKGDTYEDWKFIAPVSIERRKKIKLRRKNNEVH